MHTHASKEDLGNLERLGNPGWNFSALQQFYRKSETYNTSPAEGASPVRGNMIDPEIHGNSGPVQTAFPQGLGPLDLAWGPTFTNLGFDAKCNSRTGQILGGFPVLKSMDKMSRRSYAASAYYFPVVHRSNLTVLTNAYANKIIFKSAVLPAEAEGVSYSVEGQDFVVRARREVIICAGTVQSPQLLELSGIGRDDVLSKCGIDTIIPNSHVGENLQVRCLGWIENIEEG